MASLLTEEWARRPTADKSALRQWRSESCPVIRYLSDELDKHVSRDEVFTAIGSMANSEILVQESDRDQWGMAPSVWRVYLRGKTMRAKTTAKEQIEYLLGFCAALAQEKDRERNRLAFVQFQAAREVLKASYDSSQLGSVSREIKEKLSKYSVDQEKNAEYNNLRVRLACLDRAIREKKAAEAKGHAN